MGLFKRAGGGARGWSGARTLSSLTIPAIVVLFLVAYFFEFGSMGRDNAVVSSSSSSSSYKTDGEELLLQQQKRTDEVQKQKGCDTIEDYIEDGGYDEKSGEENAWRQMKWGLPPAKCRVNGHLIERLDPAYNYRRGVALGFTDDLDDKTHVEHWFLGTKVDLNQRKRRVYIDLGANGFHTSVLWFMVRYPCDFTEVHAFEVDGNLFGLPVGFDEESNWKEPKEPGWKKLKGREGSIPKWMVNRMHYYNKFAGDKDDQEKNLVNITRFIKNELKLTEDDAVVVKMDIEGSEWPILERWVKDPDLPKIIDELWLELHYYHPDNNWQEVLEYSREKATRMLAEMRFRGFYVHYWD